MILTENTNKEQVKIQDGKISLPEAFSFLKGMYDAFEVKPSEGSHEKNFFEQILSPLGFKIIKEEEEPEEIY